MAELLAKKKKRKLLPSITNGRLGYLEINEDKMRFKDAMKGGKAVGGNEGMTACASSLLPLLLHAPHCRHCSSICLVATTAAAACPSSSLPPQHAPHPRSSSSMYLSLPQSPYIGRQMSTNIPLFSI
jgi:hypothetical protein